MSLAAGEHMSERPDECSHCKKPIKITYTQILREDQTQIQTCLDCPIFQQKMTGFSLEHKSKPAEQEMGLCCGNCGTTLESILTGNPLGCSECYAIFEDMLLEDLISTQSIPSRLESTLKRKKSQPLHIGKSAQTSVEIPTSSRLSALNEALNDALKKENYEQAAWLRDQIKDLMEKHHDPKKPTS